MYDTEHLIKSRQREVTVVGIYVYAVVPPEH